MSLMGVKIETDKERALRALLLPLNAAPVRPLRSGHHGHCVSFGDASADFLHQCLQLRAIFPVSRQGELLAGDNVAFLSWFLMPSCR